MKKFILLGDTIINKDWIVFIDYTEIDDKSILLTVFLKHEKCLEINIKTSEFKECLNTIYDMLNS